MMFDKLWARIAPTLALPREYTGEGIRGEGIRDYDNKEELNND